ncbi:diacylglycerol kinase [Aliikangiella marina]|uniref:Diacylglycerol kinase n=1 Tax=Aliikangiella marina TaxID=1712262 RepID=A0A545T6U5_9GAMM|nr:diacylglycerol kinase [Aliikangiella marina]TQV72947.1 diacylglycerol kinase [Aliikangiella marina]
MAKPGKTGIPRIIDATGYSMKGFAAAWNNEAAFRQEVLLAAVGIPLAYLLAETKYDFLWLIMPLFLVIIAELSNSAIEAAIDRIGPEHHELSGRAKDIGSAMVFTCLTLLVVVWLVILLF